MFKSSKNRAAYCLQVNQLHKNSNFLLSSFNSDKNTPRKDNLDWGKRGIRQRLPYKFSKRTFPPFMMLSTTCRDVWTENRATDCKAAIHRYQPEWNLRWRSRFNNAPAPSRYLYNLSLHRCILRNFIDDELVR